MLNLTDEDAEILGGESTALTFGVNWYPNANIKIMANYSMIDNDENCDADGDFTVRRRGHRLRHVPDARPGRVLASTHRVGRASAAVLNLSSVFLLAAATGCGEQVLVAGASRRCSREERIMEKIIPRWEYRVFAEDLGAVEGNIRSARGHAREGERRGLHRLPLQRQQREGPRRTAGHQAAREHQRGYARAVDARDEGRVPLSCGRCCQDLLGLRPGPLPR